MRNNNIGSYVYLCPRPLPRLITVGQPTKNCPEGVIDFLRRPDAYADEPDSVEVIETHFAWVFLSRHYVYKLKKAIAFHAIDFTSLAARHANCELEIALNRRLAERVYIAAVPLSRSGDSYELESDADVVDWLVKMHRLPAQSTLEAAAVEGRVTAADLDAVMRKLSLFYARTGKASWNGAKYRDVLQLQIEEYASQIGASIDGERLDGLGRLTSSLLEFLHRRPGLFDERIDRGRVVDAHGDLRPEHVFLGDDPQIIDCLEFSTELRLLDTSEEMAFLDLECGRLGRADIGRQLLHLYETMCHDPLDLSLYEFYRSRRCLVRALVSAWHIEDYPAGRAPAHWITQSQQYLDLALASIDQALAARH